MRVSPDQVEEPFHVVFYQEATLGGEKVSAVWSREDSEANMVVGNIRYAFKLGRARKVEFQVQDTPTVTEKARNPRTLTRTRRCGERALVDWAHGFGVLRLYLHFGAHMRYSSLAFLLSICWEDRRLIDGRFSSAACG
jgi:hypothetical protein